MTDEGDLPYDVIIVLGAAVWPGGVPSPALRRRMQHAVRLFQAGQGRSLLVTGGLGQHAPSEAQVMRQLALTAGVPQGCILVEEQATSTFESAVYCGRLCAQRHWTRALLVTDCYHLPRAWLSFRSVGLQVHGSGTHSRWRPWREASYARGREVPAFLWYLIRIIVWKLCHRMS